MHIYLYIYVCVFLSYSKEYILKNEMKLMKWKTALIGYMDEKNDGTEYKNYRNIFLF